MPAKSQIHLFFSDRATTKDIPGVNMKGKMSNPIQKVAVLGGGTMGAGIVVLLIANRVPVILKEVSQKYLTAAVQRITGLFVGFKGLCLSFVGGVFDCVYSQCVYVCGYV